VSLTTKQRAILNYLLLQSKGKSANQISYNTKLNLETVNNELISLENKDYVKLEKSPSGRKYIDVTVTSEGFNAFSIK